jgi:hypothetical protein
MIRKIIPKLAKFVKIAKKKRAISRIIIKNNCFRYLIIYNLKQPFKFENEEDEKRFRVQTPLTS